MPTLRSLSDIIYGWLLGTAIAWSLTALTCTYAAFGPWRYPKDFGPMRDLFSFRYRVIDHDGGICWVLLFAAGALTLFLAAWLSRPIRKNSLFLAGYAGAVSCVLTFVWISGHTPFIGVPSRVWLRSAQFGTPVWEALRHHQNRYWTLTDEIVALKMADIVVTDLSLFVCCIALPVLLALLYRRDRKLSTAVAGTSSSASAAGRIILPALSASLCVLAYHAVRGIGPQEPEPSFYYIHCFSAAKKIDAGSRIKPGDIKEQSIRVVTGYESLLPDLEKNPFGKLAVDSIWEGEYISCNDVAPSTERKGSKYHVFYGAWQTRHSQSAENSEQTSTVKAARAVRNIPEGKTIKRDDVAEVTIAESSIDGNLPESPELTIGSTSGRIRRNQILVWTETPSDTSGIPYLYLLEDLLPEPKQ